MNIFIDTEDMEERYGEQLYQDYLVEQNKDLQQRIDEAKEYIWRSEVNSIGTSFAYTERGKDLLKILKGEDNNE